MERWVSSSSVVELPIGVAGCQHPVAGGTSETTLRMSSTIAQQVVALPRIQGLTAQHVGVVLHRQLGVRMGALLAAVGTSERDGIVTLPNPAETIEANLASTRFLAAWSLDTVLYSSTIASVHCQQ